MDSRAMRRNGIHLVCFDLGGVIIRTPRNWRESCLAAHVPYRGGVEATQMTERLREVTAEYDLGRISPETYLSTAEAILDGFYTREELGRIEQAWLLGEIPGMRTLLAELEAREVETGCLSNTNPLHWEMMSRDPERFPSFHRLRHRHASHLFGSAKPDLAIYRAFEAATGRAGHEILFFDDLEANVEAARRAGWRAEWVDREREVVTQIRLRLDRGG